MCIWYTHTNTRAHTLWTQANLVPSLAHCHWLSLSTSTTDNFSPGLSVFLLSNVITFHHPDREYYYTYNRYFTIHLFSNSKQVSPISCCLSSHLCIYRSSFAYHFCSLFILFGARFLCPPGALSVRPLLAAAAAAVCRTLRVHVCN